MHQNNNTQSPEAKPNWDGLTGIFSLLFGLGYGTWAYVLPRPMFGNPLEAIFFPMAIAALAVIIGILLIIRGGISPAIQAFKQMRAEGDLAKKDRRRIGLTCLVSVFYALTFDHLGYVLSTFGFMVCMLLITSGRGFLKQAVVIGLCFSLGVYLLFSQLLSVNLPALPLMS
ncbi:MAG: tripartite tricarboxylate transporter TctB family protein [Vibrio sp.]